MLTCKNRTRCLDALWSCLCWHLDLQLFRPCFIRGNTHHESKALSVDEHRTRRGTWSSYGGLALESERKAKIVRGWPYHESRSSNTRQITRSRCSQRYQSEAVCLSWLWYVNNNCQYHIESWLSDIAEPNAYGAPGLGGGTWIYLLSINLAHYPGAELQNTASEWCFEFPYLKWADR